MSLSFLIQKLLPLLISSVVNPSFVIDAKIPLVANTDYVCRRRLGGVGERKAWISGGDDNSDPYLEKCVCLTTS
ncbi:hypothetical protein HanIR_Chr05g0217141 [Helianthus annuus]|nr:hypothetical protein HanIR_Chr05g0217141 [Helianthus annuus]